MARRAHLAAASLVLALGSFAGCSGSTANSPPAETGAGGSGGTGGSSGAGGTSACVHTTTDDIFRRDSDTLPTGACADGTPECDLIVRDACPCNSQVPRKFYTCTCDAGAWQCKLTALDSGMCTPPSECGCRPSEGGIDAWICDGGAAAADAGSG